MIASMSYDQLAQLDEHIKQTRRQKQQYAKSPSGAPFDPSIQEKIDNVLAQIRAAIVLQGGQELPDYQLGKFTLDHLLDLFIRNNISIHVWPEKRNEPQTTQTT